MVLQKLNHQNLQLICLPEDSVLNYNCGSEFVLQNENSTKNYLTRASDFIFAAKADLEM